MADNDYPKINYDNTGEIGFGGPGYLLNSGAIGSCVVITAFESEKKLDHQMKVFVERELRIKKLENELRLLRGKQD